MNVYHTGEIMRAYYQKNLLDTSSEFNLFITDIVEYPPHWHEEIEIVYALEAGLKVGINQNTYVLDKGDIIIVGPGDVHYFINNTIAMKRIIIQIKLSALQEYSQLIMNKRLVNPLIQESNKELKGVHKQLEYHILQIQDEYQHKALGYKLAIKTYVFNIILLIIRHIPTIDKSDDEETKQLKKLEILERVFQYVELNFENDITLDQVAKVATFSTYHFTRFFKELTGMTFVTYLNTFRISKATLSLASTLNSITEISFSCGFSSIKTFNRVFKELKGVSPSAYRKAIRDL